MKLMKPISSLFEQVQSNFFVDVYRQTWRAVDEEVSRSFARELWTRVNIRNIAVDIGWAIWDVATDSNQKEPSS